MTSPAFALVAADGGVVAAGEVFNRLIGIDALSAPQLASALGAITVGNQELVGLRIDAAGGPALVTRVEAVLSVRDQRLALIEVQIPRPPASAEAVAAWFPRFADDAAAIVWLKDLEGRYRWVNRRYASELGVDPERVVGKLDSELGQLEAIDGPRIRAGARGAVAPDTPRAEPLSLEYTIPAFDRRPAYAALRFPLTDLAGTPLAVCGVASPADHNEVAQAECARLLEVADWFRGDAQTLRRGVMERWEIRAVRPRGATAVEVAAPASAEPAPVDRERGRSEERLNERIRELEAMVASASAAAVAASHSAERVVELQREVQELNRALDQERERHPTELAAVREENRRLGLELEAVRGQLEAAEARHAQELSAHARHEDELSDIQARVRSELNAANQRHHVELRHLRDQHDALLNEHGQLTESEHQARADAEALRNQLSAALAQLRELQTARAAARDQIARLERAVLAATAAAAAPAELDSTPPEPVPVTPTAATQPPAPPLEAAAPGTPTPAYEPQLGWDPAAQQALANALSGCLNFRSILSEAVRLIGAGGGWDAVVAWLPDGREGRFSCAATWVRSPVQMARLETSMWQVHQSPTSSAVGAAASSSEIAWINPLASDGDRHLASVQAEGINTVVLVPVRQQGRTSAVLELCTETVVRESPEADAALRSIEVEVGAANQRLVDGASAGQWGRRRR